MGYHDALLRRLAEAHAERSAIARAAIARHWPWPEAGVNTGGASLWLAGAAGLDARTLAVYAERSGVLIEPGDVFYSADEPPLHFIRLGLSSIPAGSIDEGIRRLSQCARDLVSTGHVLPQWR